MILLSILWLSNSRIARKSWVSPHQWLSTNCWWSCLYSKIAKHSSTIQGWCICLCLAWKTQQDIIKVEMQLQWALMLRASCAGPYCLSWPLQNAGIFASTTTIHSSASQVQGTHDFDSRLYLKTLHGIFAALSEWRTLRWRSGSRSRAALRCLRRRIFEHLLHFTSKGSS